MTTAKHPSSLARLRWVAGFLCAVSATVVAAPASAIMLGNNAPVDLHDGTKGVLDGSRADCLAGKGYTWAFTDVTANDSLSVWATTTSLDCSLAANRQMNGCIQIGDSTNITNTTTTRTVSIPELAEAVTPIDPVSCTDSGAANDSHVVTVYFLVNGSSADVAVGDYYQTEVTLDFNGPGAATIDSVGVGGDTSLTVTWKTTTGTDIAGYQVFCQQATSDCAAPDLVPGEVPDPALRCDDTSNDGTKGNSGTAINLEEGVLYAVGVGAVDVIGNSGPLSELLCGSPEPVIGFYDALESAGEIDSLCSISMVTPARGERGPWLLAMLGLGGLAGLRRRR